MVWKVRKPTKDLLFTVEMYSVKDLHKKVVEYLRKQQKRFPERYPFKSVLQRDIFFEPRGTDRVSVRHVKVPHTELVYAEWDTTWSGSTDKE